MNNTTNNNFSNNTGNITIGNCNNITTTQINQVTQIQKLISENVQKSLDALGVDTQQLKDELYEEIQEETQNFLNAFKVGIEQSEAFTNKDKGYIFELIEGLKEPILEDK